MGEVVVCNIFVFVVELWEEAHHLGVKVFGVGECKQRESFVNNLLSDEDVFKKKAFFLA